MATGSIDRRKGRNGVTYRVRIPLGYDAEGKRRVISETFRTRREAEEFRTRTLHDLHTRAYIEPSTITVAEYARHWLESLPPGTAMSSRVAYASRLANAILPELGDRTLSELTPTMIQGWVNAIRQRYAPSTAGHHFTVLRSLLNQAVRERVIPASPADAVRTGGAPSIPEATTRLWSPHELTTFLDATREHPDWPLWWTAANTGLRPGELVVLHWDDVDLERRTVTVRATQTVINRAGHRVRRDEPKVPASLRTIGIDPETVLVLRGQRARQQAQRATVGLRWQDEGLVFDRGDGTAHNEVNLNKRFISQAHRLGMPHLTLHGLRHLHGSVLAASGRPLHYIQRRLGHGTLATTARFYLHLMPGTEHADSEAFAAALRDARVQTVSTNEARPEISASES